MQLKSRLIFTFMERKAVLIQFNSIEFNSGNVCTSLLVAIHYTEGNSTSTLSLILSSVYQCTAKICIKNPSPSAPASLVLKECRKRVLNTQLRIYCKNLSFFSWMYRKTPIYSTRRLSLISIFKYSLMHHLKRIPLVRVYKNSQFSCH